MLVYLYKLRLQKKAISDEIAWILIDDFFYKVPVL